MREPDEMDITCPVRVFEQLTHRLSLERAALLVVDHTPAVFSVLACIGLDVTTQRRLRIPAELLNRNKRLLSGEVLRISSEGATFLEPFFSTRVFDLLDSLTIVPLRHEGGVFSVVVVLNEDETGPNAELNDRDYATIIEYEELLYRCHTGRLSALPALPAERFRSHPDRFLAAEIAETDRRRARLLCVLMNVKSIIGDVISSSVTVDAFRFLEDLLRILHSLVHANGAIIPVGPEEFLLCMRTRHATDPGFVLDHVAMTLRDFYSDLSTLDSAVSSSAYYPDDAATVETLLDRLGVQAADD